MVLVDTSVWINHFQKKNVQLQRLLLDYEVICHSFIIGELACGNIKNRDKILSLLRSLPMASSIEFDEFLFFLEKNKLNGKGIGFVDVNLLASTQLDQIKLWTMDKRLEKVAIKLGLNYIE